MALTDKSLDTEARIQAAENIMAGVAANDAYLASRGELERIIAQAQGGQIPPSHAELNKDAPEAVATSGAVAVGAGSVDSTATEVDLGAPEAGDTPEVAALREKIRELEGSK